MVEMKLGTIEDTPPSPVFIYKEGGKYDFLGFLFLVICFILIGVFTIYCILR